ncbi:MAG: sugar phosphate isomerase/epimerase, partial [Clostridia bacterium]|nr:sugar phosphate isomerase/epimerase [Clostridia bacterium]
MYVSTEISSYKQYGTIFEIVKLLKDSGFTAYDFSMFAGWAGYELLTADDYIEQAQKLRAYADAIGIVCNQSHAPFPTVRKGCDEYNQAQFPIVIRAIEVSGILGASVCVVHPCNDYTAEENAVFYNSLMPYAKKAGIKIGVENMWNWFHWGKTGEHVLPAACSHQDDFKKHLDLLDKQVFCACLDIGHSEMMHAYGTDAVKMIETLGDDLQAIHLHDVNLTNDNHSLPFTQAIDYAPIIEALRKVGYKGDITLESNNFSNRLPVALIPAAARYAAAVANYFKEEIEK